MLKAIPNALLGLIFPQKCHLCGGSVENADDGVVCGYCWNKCRFFTGLETMCAKCGEFHSDEEAMFESFCGKCDEHFYGSARAVGQYHGGIAASVLHLKTQPYLPNRIARSLEIAFDQTFRSETTLIIPVPLSAKRHLERGFNQAAVIAGTLAQYSGIPMDEHSLVRKIHTPVHRAAMDRKARERTVKNAFEIKRPKLIAEQSVLLVDDIFTSGATASHCAKTLKKSGAAQVNVLTLARAV